MLPQSADAVSRICRSCSRRGAAEGDFEASFPAFAAVAQDAGRPKAILKHRFPLLPQLLKARGGIKIAPKGRPGGFCACRPCVWACAPHFPLLPQLLKAQGGRRRFCSITSRFRRSCSGRGRRGRRRCSPPRRGWASRSLGSSSPGRGSTFQRSRDREGSL